MVKVRLKSLAKVNLDLRVLQRRPDGYHDLRTVFQTISLADTLEIEFEKARRTELTIEDALAIPDNLVLRAARSVLDAMRMHARVRFRLTKRIPMGGGLGGGSSNAASVLLALPFLGARAVPFDRLQELAAGLGSDVPFFLTGGTALGLGRGEELYPLADLAAEPLLLVCSGLHVSTPEAYRSLNRCPAEPGAGPGPGTPGVGLTFTPSSRSINSFQAFVRSLVGGRSAKGASSLSANDFEAAVFRQYPQLRTITGKLWKVGAAGVRMTGSGSAVYAIFDSLEERACAEAALTKDSLRKNGVLAGCRLLRAQLVSRRGYRSLWLRQLGVREMDPRQSQLPERLNAGERVWPPQNQYAR